MAVAAGRARRERSGLQELALVPEGPEDFLEQGDQQVHGRDSLIDLAYINPYISWPGTGASATRIEPVSDSVM